MLDAKALHLAEKKKSASFKKKQVTWSHLKSPVASCHCFAPLTVALLQCLRCVWKCSVTKQCAFPAWLKLSIPADKPYNCEQRSAFPGSINSLPWEMAIALRILSIFEVTELNHPKDLHWQNVVSPSPQRCQYGLFMHIFPSLRQSTHHGLWATRSCLKAT